MVCGQTVFLIKLILCAGLSEMIRDAYADDGHGTIP